MINRGLFTSKTDEWETPQKFFDSLNAEFQFTLDVCANEKNAKCRSWFGKENSGLEQTWSRYDRCWMNPPYGKEIGRWVKKAFDESRTGTLVVALLPARTDTAWFHDHIYGKAEIRFLRGRLKFGESTNSAPFPSMVVIWR